MIVVGGPLGNLYYFSWFSFFLCFGIGKSLYEDYVYAMEVAEVEFQEDNRRTTVPSLERHDEDEEANGSGVAGVAGVATASSPTSAAGQNQSEGDGDLEPKMRRIDEDDDI